jgi:hypothetical protein
MEKPDIPTPDPELGGIQWAGLLVFVGASLGLYLSAMVVWLVT